MRSLRVLAALFLRALVIFALVIFVCGVVVVALGMITQSELTTLVGVIILILAAVSL